MKNYKHSLVISFTEILERFFFMMLAMRSTLSGVASAVSAGGVASAISAGGVGSAIAAAGNLGVDDEERAKEMKWRGV